ncbi:SDR family oxidoreductase [bacterium]|nr:SDR family oxidoreductase [bacterium]
MNLGLAGKSAIVCAASKGLGRASALELAAEGANVAICARDEDRLAQTRREIDKAGGRCVAVVADMKVEADRARFFETAARELGPIDILVNNAGGPPPGGATAFGVADYRDAVELNMLSAIDMSARALPSMRERGFGRIVNIVSIAALQPIPHLALSNAARAGLLGYAKTLASEVARDGVTVNSLCPGSILTDRVRSMLPEGADEHSIPESGPLADLIRAIPVGRMGRPDEFGAVVAFLASERASYMTGVALLVDGGACRAIF